MVRQKHFKRRLLNKDDKIQQEHKSIEIIKNPFQTSLNYVQAQKMVEITFENNKFYLNMSEPIVINVLEREEEEKENVYIKRQNTVKAVPDVNMKIVDNGKYPWHLEEKQMPSSYVKYIEKTSEELDELIEYDLDEEDIKTLDKFFG